MPLTGDEPAGRKPTLAELLAAVASLAEHDTTLAEGHDDAPVASLPPHWFQIHARSRAMRRFACEGQWRNTVAPGIAEEPASWLVIDGRVDADGSVALMSCQGHSAPLLAVVRALVAACGPQVMFADCAGIPWLVLTSDSVPIGPEPWWGDLPDGG
ncbi:MAG: hypothetical protein HZB16_17595 [Armatimonadetes bacterium]|nr:hypothetical protein [Armatimonadota bacterium]